MAELLDTDALQLWICDPLGEEYSLCKWLLNYKIVPYVSPSSLARLHHHYRVEDYPDHERETAIRMLEATGRETKKVEQSQKVHSADFDGEAAALWGKLASLPNLLGEYSSFDLILPATAIRHGHRLIAGENSGELEALAGQIPPDIGILNVISAEDLT